MNEEVEKHLARINHAKLVGAGFRDPVDEVAGVCPCCKIAATDIGKRMLNTAYADEERNWLTSCRDCYEEEVEHYQDLWDQYYSEVM